MTWPVLKHYDTDHLARIALPLGGIGTGTVSLGGRGDLRDWELMNRPAKGFTPRGIGGFSGLRPFFAIHLRDDRGAIDTRALEGPLELGEYEGASGSPANNHGLPRFRHAAFDAAYPLAQVQLRDPQVPIDVRLEAFNPMIPGDVDRSSLPVAVLRYVLSNPTDRDITATVCGSLPNYIGINGNKPGGEAKQNRNTFHNEAGVAGVFMFSQGVSKADPAWGTMALSVCEQDDVTYRTNWPARTWGNTLLNFWDDLTDDGAIDEPSDAEPTDKPMASVAARVKLPAGGSRAITFLLTWHFPNRQTWRPKPAESGDCGCDDGNCQPGDDPNWIGNYYTTQHEDAWAVARHVAANLPALEHDTVSFVSAFCESDLPDVVKEAALFNLSTLRSQTCFRTPDGRFYGWEGCHDNTGCCHGSCTHVWNYEPATALLFGELARTMREVEFAQATDERGLMSFRVQLPLHRAREYDKAAADGQMGCLMKVYREWQLCGDDDWLRGLWPHVKRAIEFCWIDGGWDGDRDGVMEGCQHNTMDVEYFGPNPQMQAWYLGALRACEEMARYLGEDDFATTCRDLFERGRTWFDANLFNGDYYEHEIRPATGPDAVAPGLAMREVRPDPILQLGTGCLVDQLVGQYMAHLLGLDYLLDPDHIRTTYQSIKKHNWRDEFFSHFNAARSYALGDESALLMASYPRGNRPEQPFPYFTEVMTGFEYTAAVGMLQEGLIDDGLECIAAIRARYDGAKRSPFDEAECGHHYARAMASWAAVQTLTGFHYSAVTGAMRFAASPTPATWFWSTGDGWGTLRQDGDQVELRIASGEVRIERLTVGERDVPLDAIRRGD